MNEIGKKIRGIRTLKGLSQENLASDLGLSLPAYADIERGKKDVTITRLEEIAEKLGVTLNDILSYNEKIANFFDQCNNTNISTGNNNGSNATNFYDAKELRHELEKSKLEIEKLQMEIAKLSAEKAKAELEIIYLKERK